MLKIINKYKLGIIGFSIVLSGCSTTDYLKFKAECAKLPDNYINNSLTPEYEKEKSFYAIENDFSVCIDSTRCRILEKKERWDFVEIFLTNNRNAFPQKSGYYKIYRDYKFENCVSQYHSLNNSNSFKNSKGNFCIAAQEIEKPESKIIFKHKIIDNPESSNIIKIKTEVTYKNIKYLYVEKLMFFTPSGSSETCVNKNAPYLIIFNQFN